MTLNQQSLLFLLFISFILASCSKIQKVTDVIVQPTEREKYERNFEANDSMYLAWKTEFTTRKSDSLLISLPYVEQGQFTNERPDAYSYIAQVKQGERLIVKLENVPDTSSVFINVYPQFSIEKNEGSETFEGLINTSRQVILENGTDENYKIIIQPEIQLESAFVLKIYTEPNYAFPVAGKTSDAIQSFWGATRDGGKRSHQGVDIFAKRGTPVIAIVKGNIRKTGEFGLGGKQVWLKEGMFGNSLYYAHLDSINIKMGARVKVGDTLGFVGNSGNAKTTAPHLHFGIYRGYQGAIDPLPYIKESELLVFKIQLVASKGKITNSPSNIRIGPNSKYEKITTIKSTTEISILGKTKDWFHITLPSGERGFIHESLVRENTEPLTT